MTPRFYTDRMEFTPKRVTQAARSIQAILDKGSPGDRLPSEIELARQLSVSRTTVRDALTRLWLEDKITRRWGVGTFISEHNNFLGGQITTNFLDLDEVGSLPRRIADAGHVPSLRWFNSGITSPPAWVAAEFGLAPHDTVQCVERCLAVDGKPALFLFDYVPLVVRGRELDLNGLGDLGSDFPTLFLETGLRLVKQAASLDARLPDELVAEQLGLAMSEPVLHAEQRSYAESGETVICTDGFYVTEIFGTVLVRTIS